MDARNCDARATRTRHEFRQLGRAATGKSAVGAAIVSEN
jgi:hypothetical protein